MGPGDSEQDAFRVGSWWRLAGHHHVWCGSGRETTCGGTATGLQLVCLCSFNLTGTLLAPPLARAGGSCYTAFVVCREGSREARRAARRWLEALEEAEAAEYAALYGSPAV